MIYKEKLHWWLNDDFKGKEVVRYKDRIEFRIDNQLHNISSAAVKFTKNTIDDLYYINGIKLTYEEWNFKLRKRKILKLIENTKKNA